MSGNNTRTPFPFMFSTLIWTQNFSTRNIVSDQNFYRCPKWTDPGCCNSKYSPPQVKETFLVNTSSWTTRFPEFLFPQQYEIDVNSNKKNRSQKRNRTQ